MTCLEEFEKITANFEYARSQSSEEYLMQYVMPTLSKLISQVAKVRPKNPVDFLVSTVIICQVFNKYYTLLRFKTTTMLKEHITTITYYVYFLSTTQYIIS